MKWTKDMLDLFFAMKDEGCGIDEICVALGCGRQTVYDKVKSLKKLNGGTLPKYRKDNDMSCYGKSVQIDPAEMWQMVDEGKSRKEIADHYGVSVQTIANRITKGRPKIDKIGNVAVVADDVGTGIQQVCDLQGGPSLDTPTETVDTPTENVIETTENVIETTETVEDERDAEDVVPYEGDTDMDNGGISGLYKNTKGAREHSISAREDNTMPDIMDLAFRAKYMASDAGFTPDHMMLDVQDVRSEIIVSGKGVDGKVYEIQFSVTDPMHFSPSV